MNDLPTRDYPYVRNRLLNREEIALLDVRDEGPHATGHPLFAANLPLALIRYQAHTRLPRRDVPIVTIDAGEGLAELAARRLIELGYTDVAVFDGGIAAWRAGGGELFIDVNAPSKAFGELMESVCHTPELSAQEVVAMRARGDNMVVIDVRPYNEYSVSCVPGGINVPGAELALRLPGLVPDPETQVVINCAGRTRGLIGTQSLVNFGLLNKVYFLRNGTIGWRLAQQPLELGQSRTYGAEVASAASRRRARELADRAGVQRTDLETVGNWMAQQGRTTYLFDVRSDAEYDAGHLPGAYAIPGGQLVQETEMHAPVRGARMVLVDDDGVRANMTAHWLAQMAWEVYVLDCVDADRLTGKGRESISGAERRAGESVVPYQRPYVGTQVTPDIMQAYLDWEFGLVEQLRRDGSHHFQVLTSEST